MSAEEEIVDPKPIIEEACKQSAECSRLVTRMDTCAERVAKDDKTEETCVEEFFDLMHCVHHCVSSVKYKTYGSYIINW
jgi:ubiquinol-cytochrome c reductase subunit 6